MRLTLATEKGQIEVWLAATHSSSPMLYPIQTVEGTLYGWDFSYRILYIVAVTRVEEQAPKQD